jgi:protein phosphatase
MQGLRMEVHGATHVGRVRQNNEDAFGFDAERGILVLADGVGGQAGGEVASQLAVDWCQQQVRSLLDAQNQSPAESRDFSEQLRDEVIVCNARIYSESQTRPGCYGMSTTLVLGVIHANQLFYCHLGDSRLYRLRQGSLQQLTQDHTLAQELENTYGAGAGDMTPSNIITRALGAALECNPDCASSDLQKDDLFLFCSDGLSNHLGLADLRGSLSAGTDLEALAQQLIDEANWCGGRDNISVILLRIRES